MHDVADLVYRAKCVILDSGLCVLKAIIKLKNKGVYASAVVKKRRYQDVL